MSYRSKSTDSFNTRKRLFIFNCVIHDMKDFSDQEFLDFVITNDLIQCYTAEYFQFLPSDTLFTIPCSKKISVIYAELKAFETYHDARWKELDEAYFNVVFQKHFPEEDFNDLINAHECFYCGITKVDISLLVEAGKIYKKNDRGWNFEIDRMKPNQEYTKENCVAACYWCNNAKTDELDDIEFKPIGELIGKTLKERLNK